MVRGIAPSVTAAAPITGRDPDDHHSRSLDNSVNAVSFGLVATAVLISLFLVMAIFERFLRRPHPSPNAPDGHDEPDATKPDYPSPKMSMYARGVSVLMPGERVPTYLAHPMPTPYNAQSFSPRAKLPS